VHDTARAPALTPTDPLYYKALAVRLQLVVYEQTIQLAEAQARLASAERQAMTAGLAAIERDARELVQPPEDHRFNWQTLAFEPPPDPPAR
jgi:hypothetical protein